MRLAQVDLPDFFGLYEYFVNESLVRQRPLKLGGKPKNMEIDAAIKPL